eukprot:1395099-Amorphochlora_amoeboformis.AAC.1
MILDGTTPRFSFKFGGGASLDDRICTAHILGRESGVARAAGLGALTGETKGAKGSGSAFGEASRGGRHPCGRPGLGQIPFLRWRILHISVKFYKDKPRLLAGMRFLAEKPET